jgi:hypothetical protein
MRDDRDHDRDAAPLDDGLDGPDADAPRDRDRDYDSRRELKSQSFSKTTPQVSREELVAMFAGEPEMALYEKHTAALDRWEAGGGRGPRPKVDEVRLCRQALGMALAANCVQYSGMDDGYFSIYAPAAASDYVHPVATSALQALYNEAHADVAHGGPDADDGAESRRREAARYPKFCVYVEATAAGRRTAIGGVSVVEERWVEAAVERIRATRAVTLVGGPERVAEYQRGREEEQRMVEEDRRADRAEAERREREEEAFRRAEEPAGDAAAEAEAEPVEAVAEDAGAQEAARLAKIEAARARFLERKKT